MACVLKKEAVTKTRMDSFHERYGAITTGAT